MKLIESPDCLRFSKLASLSFDNPAAITFVVLPEGCVLASKRPHTFIYNALRICTGERSLPGSYSAPNGPQSGKPLSKSECSRILKDYESWVATPSIPLSEEVLNKVLDVQKKYKGVQQVADFWRRVLTVGRLWKRVKIPEIGVVNAMSFWLESSKLPQSDIDHLIKTFDLSGPVYIEALDSTQPDLYSGAESKTFLPNSRKQVVSAVAPHLSKDEIYNIVIKAHNTPWSLTALEKEVAAEWYGKGLPVPGSNGGYTTKAELNFRKTIGDSVIPTRFLDLFERHKLPTS